MTHIPLRCVILAVVGLPLVVWISTVMIRLVKDHTAAAKDMRAIVRAIDDAIHYQERSIRYNEKWVPEDFFESAEAIQACHVISTGDNELLADLLNTGIDVNMTGKKGVTLLHWAFFDDMLDAFTQLLDAGADPNLKLTDVIERERHRAFVPGDSILFSTMRIGQWDYFFAAFDCTSDKNQVDAGGRTLLNACVGLPEIFSLPEDALQRIIDAGVDLDGQDQYGCTAAMKALNNGRPKKCLMLLKAGADPSIPDNRGNTIADRLPVVRAGVKRSVSDIPRPHSQYLLPYDQVQDWLDQNAASGQAAKEERKNQHK